MIDKIITTWWSYEDVTMNEEDNIFEEFLQETGISEFFREWVVRSFNVDDIFDLLERRRYRDTDIDSFMEDLYEDFSTYVYDNPEEYGIVIYDAEYDNDIDE